MRDGSNINKAELQREGIKLVGGGPMGLNEGANVIP